MRRSPFVQTCAALAGALLIASCGNRKDCCGPPPAGNGVLALRVRTTGEMPDSDGYSLSVDGSPRAVATEDSLALALPAGSHGVSISGVAANCAASVGGLRELAAAETLRVAVDVACSGPDLVFQSGNGASAEIVVALSDGRAAWTLTHNAAVDSSPSWSPDGTRIVFFSDRDGTSDVYSMRFDGSDARRHTADAAIERDPTYWPDGSKLLFTASALAAGGSGTAVDLFTLDTAGGAQPVRLTTSAPGIVNRRPRVSPDGSMITLWRNDAGHGHVYLVPATGGVPARLTNDSSSSQMDPAWNADGTMLVFANGGDVPPGTLVRIRPDGTGASTVPTSGFVGFTQHPTWAATGELAFVEMETPFAGSPRRIFIVPASGGLARQLTIAGTLATAPAWRPRR